jgi:hypothetical protein
LASIGDTNVGLGLASEAHTASHPIPLSQRMAILNSPVDAEVSIRPVVSEKKKKKNPTSVTRKLFDISNYSFYFINIPLIL